MIFSPSEAAFIRQAANRIVPGCRTVDEEEWKRIFSIIEEGLAKRPFSVQRQFKAFLLVLRLAATLRQDGLFYWFENCPITLFRKGFWGLKTMIYMGYYGRPEIWPSLNYHLSKNGNEKLGQKYQRI